MSTSNDMAVSEQESAALLVLELSMLYAYPAALRAAVLIGVADHLVDRPKTADEIAQATSTDGKKLYRVLRLLASRGVFEEDSEGRFELTPAADLLRSDVPHSLQGAIRMITDKTFYVSTGELVQSVRGAGGPFDNIFGTSFFEYWSREVTPEENFHVGMASMTEIENDFVVRSYDFPKRATVVDVGGGYGALLLRVLQDNPTLRGILFDQEHVLAKHRLEELGDDSRWELMAGDFFEKCPRADVYMLKYILHDWDDERALQVLRTCREAMAPSGRVLVFDPVVPPGNSPHTSKLMDMIVMGIYSGGRERTEEEFRQLLAEAGLRLTRVIDTGSHVSITEAVPA